MDDALDLPSYIEEEMMSVTEEPLIKDVVSPAHPITARKDILKAASISKLRQKILHQERASPTQRMLFIIVALLILCISVIVSAKILDHGRAPWWLLLLWLAILVILGGAYVLIFQ